MMAGVADWAGRLDALVNNAGVADFGPIEETDFARWRTVMATNLDGVFLCSQAAILHLKASRGAIVNIASISGLSRLDTFRTAYGTSKAAVIHLTQQQAAELANRHPRELCRAGPGPHETGDGGAYAGHHRRLSRRHSAEPLWQRGGNRRDDHLPCDGAVKLGRASALPPMAVREHRCGPAGASRRRPDR